MLGEIERRDWMEDTYHLQYYCKIRFPPQLPVAWKWMEDVLLFQSKIWKRYKEGTCINNKLQIIKLSLEKGNFNHKQPMYMFE